MCVCLYVHCAYLLYKASDSVYYMATDLLVI